MPWTGLGYVFPNIADEGGKIRQPIGIVYQYTFFYRSEKQASDFLPDFPVIIGNIQVLMISLPGKALLPLFTAEPTCLSVNNGLSIMHVLLLNDTA